MLMELTTNVKQQMRKPFRCWCGKVRKPYRAMCKQHRLHICTYIFSMVCQCGKSYENIIGWKVRHV